MEAPCQVLQKFSSFTFSTMFWALFFVLCSNLPADALDPERKIVFTRWARSPSGWERQNDSALFGINERFIKNTQPPKQFRFTYKARQMNYTFYATNEGSYTIRFGMYEKPDCKIGKRNTKFIVNGVTSPVFDISTEAGCGNPFYLDISFPVLADKKIVFKMKRCCGGAAPFVSNMQLYAGSPSPLPAAVSNFPSSSPSAASVSNSPIAPSVSSTVGPSSSSVPTSPVLSPSSSQALPSASSSKAPASASPLPSQIEIDIGPSYEISGTTAIINSGGSIDTSSVSNVPSSAFTTAREGLSFTLSFPLPPGVYTVILGFVELDTALCVPSGRVFNVLINGFLRLESYDIYSTVGACRKAVSERFIDQVVDPLNPQPFTVEFQGVAEDAILNYIRVSPKSENCAPIDDDIEEDHLAHAVPGFYPPNDEPAYVDSLNNGFVSVRIDGSGSHTHFASGEIQGSLTSYTWILPETGKVIATTAAFTRKFFLGTTRLRLIVVDNACSRDEAETSVTVTGNILSGTYCYYYDGLSELPMGGTLLNSPRPTFSQRSSSLSLGFPSFSFKNSNFVARCLFFLEFDDNYINTELSISTSGTGDARLYRGSDLIIDSATATNSAPETTSVGLAAYELLYRRSDLSSEPFVRLFVNGSVPNVFHDRSTVLPIISSIDPPSGPVSGGSKTIINGFGLFGPLTAKFGSNSVSVDGSESTNKAAVVFPPSVSSAQVVDVTLQSLSGIESNPIPYEYGSTCDPIGFTSMKLTKSDGSNFDFDQPTAVTIWQDGKIYAGTRQGYVKVVGYDSDSLVVTSTCQSQKITDSRYIDKNGNPSQRSVLGITFDPRDIESRPYVAVSSLFWQRQGNIDLSNDEAWSNGAIERLKPASATTMSSNPNICLEYDRNIVRYLPVADGDHSVNEIVFSQNGDLLIAVGGNTNAGLPYANLGGNFGAFLSGAVVVARLSKPGYSGEISYTTPTNLRTAMPQTDDVELYATGVRNLFSMAMTRSGRIYAADMGPNCGFGNVSSACSEYNETEAALRSTTAKVPFPGTAIVGEGDCTYGAYRKDKLLEIKAGKYYGHSNLIRGTRLNEPEECVWIDPLTGLSPPPVEATPPPNYEHNLLLIKSATTGVREYGANLFCGKLRGDIILSVFKSRKTYQVKIKSDGTASGSPVVLTQESGIRVDENHHGDLILPNYQDTVTYVLRPNVAVKVGIFVSNAIPFRHGRAGGTLIRIGGWGFQSATPVTVTIGGVNSQIVDTTDSEIVCKVPPFSGSGELKDVVVSVGGVSSVLEKAVLYMSV